MGGFRLQKSQNFDYVINGWSLTYLKSHVTTLGLWLQTNMLWIFQMSYSIFILVKGLQKYHRSKLEIKKKLQILPNSTQTCPGTAELAIFFQHLTLTLIFLQSLDQKECWVHHLKNLWHICLEPEAQRNDMTFKVCNLGSKFT